jgi:hypothetical protein
MNERCFDLLQIELAGVLYCSYLRVCILVCVLSVEEHGNVLYGGVSFVCINNVEYEHTQHGTKLYVAGTSTMTRLEVPYGTWCGSSRK